jgi:hypothetical protein
MRPPSTRIGSFSSKPTPSPQVHIPLKACPEAGVRLLLRCRFVGKEDVQVKSPRHFAKQGCIVLNGMRRQDGEARSHLEFLPFTRQHYCG